MTISKDKKGKVITQILILLVIMVFASAAILVLVKSGLVTVKEDIQIEPVLNAEFLPTATRHGSLTVTSFEFCDFVDDYFDCQNQQNEFYREQNVYIRFVVESTTYNDEVTLLRNYRIKDPDNQVVLELDQKNSYTFGMKSKEISEPVIFADYFVLPYDAALGEYALEVVIENPLLDKKVVVTKRFSVIG